MECINFAENGILEENSMVLKEIKNDRNRIFSAYSNILSNIECRYHLCFVYSSDFNYCDSFTLYKILSGEVKNRRSE